MSSHRDELMERRRTLQGALRERAGRDAQRRSVAYEAAALDAAGVPHEFIWPEAGTDAHMRWIEDRFPAGVGRVDWGRVPGSSCRRCSSRAERDALFRAALDRHCPAPECPVVIVWGNAIKPVLQMSAAHAREHAALLLDADFDTWVYSPRGTWLIEYYHEGELCSGTSRPAT